jgi:hypothetical protein
MHSATIGSGPTSSTFADDADWWRACGLGIVERPSCDDWQMECLEVRRADDLKRGQRTLARTRRRVANDLER